METDGEPTQHTQPRGTDDKEGPAEPTEIPVPERDDFERRIKRAVTERKKMEADD